MLTRSNGAPITRKSVKTLNKREALKAAINLAAAKLEAMDLVQVFGEEVVDQVQQNPGLDEILDQAQKLAVARIRGLVKT